MRHNRSTVTAAAAVAGVVLLSGTPASHAAAVEREVVSSDESGDVEADCGEDSGLVAATDVTEVAYRIGDAPAHQNPGVWAVKIRITHGETLTDDGHEHRAVTKFNHEADDYRLVSTLDTATLAVRQDDAWAEVVPTWMVAKGGDGKLIVKFPVAVFGPAFEMDELRTKLVVVGTSIVDRTATEDALPVYPPR
ncbi:MAG: hypothetical protein AVDCRST_MAG36-2031 [uncultured Nocardioidaceae bacterium]|uniref:Uncharacterized protein n=1 Tax=uncultured Nocardioidaceae bacterium TaxID=253824 RepID=A0A6J4M912_9ACTN|nr:MAG: hypothetical protein AVDCRST_MAG36-2031 [uncultured Nocardioidaceae bacterium]